MRILYIYRHPDMGFSIGKVFKPIEEEMKKYAEVASLYLPVANYSIKGLLKNIAAVRKAIRAQNYDIVHITGQEHYLIPFLPKNNLIVTVHDLGSILNSCNWLKRLLFVNTLSLPKAVTFISDFSKNETLTKVVIPQNKLYIVNNPYDSTFSYCYKNFNHNLPTILHIGTKSNKNLLRVIKALENMTCNFRIIGKISDDVRTQLEESKIVYSIAQNLTDSQIVEEYNKCDIVSFPSVYEGFGMPIIEGNVVGRVVVTSNIEPMKSVAGGSCVLVDPYDVSSIRKGFCEAIDNHKLFVEKGLNNAKRFEVRHIVSDYINVYNKVLGK